MRTCHPHCCSLLSTRSCWLHSSITLSDVLDDFLLRLLGVSLSWPCPGCADSRCASCAPPDRLLLDHLVPLRFSRSSLVLSVASCNVTSFTVSCVKILLRSHGLSIPPKGTTPEIVYSGSLRLYVSSTMACPDALTASFTVQSYLSAHLRCAAYFSRVSACWLYS